MLSFAIPQATALAKMGAIGNGAHPNGSSLPPGVYVPTVAFFDPETDEVDVATTEKHAIRLAEAGVTGLVTHGSNGEAVHLDHAERKLVNSTTRKALDSSNHKDVILMVGCGAQSTRETIILCKEAAESGGSAALILPPSYYGSLLPTPRILQHFTDVADVSPIPLLIYNYPGACAGLDLNSDSILALAAHPNIIGVKLTCGNTGKLARIVGSAAPPFLTLGGSADFLLQTLVVGGHGTIAGTANIAPRTCVRLLRLVQDGKLEEAKKLQGLLARGDWPAIQGGFPAVKAALQLYHGYGGTPRKPCVLPEKAELAALKTAFAELVDFERSL